MKMHDLVERAGDRALTAITAYDAPTAARVEKAAIDIIFVGDSVGTNVLGYASEREVTLQDILHHLKAVRRGAGQTYVLADLPAETYQTPAAAIANARLLSEAGADGIKFEGPRPEIAEALASVGIEPWGHLGFTPQTEATPALHAKTADRALELLDQAAKLESAGAACLVLELVPEEVAEAVTERLAIPTIGIGAGRLTTGQVQIIYDVLGASPREFRHSRPLAHIGPEIDTALTEYRSSVQQRTYLIETQPRHLEPDQAAAFRRLLRGESHAS